jgi:hypothetical protein
MTAMATTPNPDHHIVIAALGGRQDRALIGHCAVSAPLEWQEAQLLWGKLDKERRAGVRVTGGGRTSPRGHVLHYAVRSVADPRWSSLVGLGYADAHSKDGKRSFKGDDGKVKAAKVWAKEFGYRGAGGGWIYGPDNKPHTQGWGSLAYELQRRGAIAQGSDNLWYVLDRPLVP